MRNYLFLFILSLMSVTKSPLKNLVFFKFFIGSLFVIQNPYFLQFIFIIAIILILINLSVIIIIIIIFILILIISFIFKSYLFHLLLPRNQL